jgi:hypothetical protein
MWVTFPSACGAYRSRQRDRRLAYPIRRTAHHLQYTPPLGAGFFIVGRKRSSSQAQAPCSRAEVEERAMIRTECHTADDALTVEFDATPWLEEADADSIVLLSRQDWSGPAAADALETRPGPPSPVAWTARRRSPGSSRIGPRWPNRFARRRLPFQPFPYSASWEARVAHAHVRH